MSNTVTFQDAMGTLQSMFSHVPPEQIKSILLQHRGVMERAVDTLLQFPAQPAGVAPAPASTGPPSSNALGAQIQALEQQKQAAIQRESFLEAESIKNQIATLRSQQAGQAAKERAAAEAAAAAAAVAAVQASATSSNNADGEAANPFNTDFDELTPLFLRRRAPGARPNVELPELFLRSPAFRKTSIEHKILASGLALQLHDEMQQQEQQRRTRSGSASASGATTNGPRQPNKAQMWFKNLGDKARVGFQKLKEGLQKPGAKGPKPAAAPNSAEELLVDDAGMSPMSRARAPSNQEYAAMDEDGSFDPFEEGADSTADFDGVGGGNAARNQMLWKMNRKPAASLAGFEMSDIGSGSGDAKQPLTEASADPYGHEETEAQDEEDDDGLDDGLGEAAAKPRNDDFFVSI